MASGRYGGYLARKQTHLHKLAMVLAAAKSSTLVITKTTLSRPRRSLPAEASMIRVFESMGVVDEGRHVAELVRFRQSPSMDNSKDLYRQCFNIMPEREFRQALRIAIEGELLEVEKRAGVLGVKPKQRTIN
jgi:hypothetical protein